jgi:hypothetical protein
MSANCRTRIFSDFKNGNEGFNIHLPLADFTCTGKHVWCGNNKPLAKEIADALWASLAEKNRNTKYMPCIYVWRSAPVKSDMGIVRDECQRVMGTSRKFVCQLATP